jgi:hypothetical protein
MVISLTFIESFLEPFLEASCIIVAGQRNRVLRAEREDRQALAEVL